MYLTPLRARAFFVAAASAALLAACSGAGQSSLTPSAGGVSPAAGSSSRSAQNTVITPTPAPTATPAAHVRYKIVTGLVMDGAGNFSEESSECRKDADSFESETSLSLTVAQYTTLDVCTADSDRHRHDDARVIQQRTFQPTPTPAPTATPGVLTDLVIIQKSNGDDDEDGGGTVVLTSGANLYNGVWTFTSLGNPLVIEAERHYKFYVAQPVSEGDGDHHGHHHDGHDH